MEYFPKKEIYLTMNLKEFMYDKTYMGNVNLMINITD